MTTRTGSLEVNLRVPLLFVSGTHTAPGVPAATDTSNAFDGLSLGGLGIALIEVPVATPPAASSTVRVDKAIALPRPTLVKGRPT